MYDLVSFMETKFGLTYTQVLDRIRADISKMKPIQAAAKEVQELVFDFIPEDIKISEDYWKQY